MGKTLKSDVYHKRFNEVCRFIEWFLYADGDEKF